MSLRLNESLNDYFQDKQKLQHYVYPVGTSEINLIEDMLDGIPQTLKPIIKANIKPLTTPEEFRRILIDLEPGLPPGLQKTARATNSYVAPQQGTLVCLMSTPQRLNLLVPAQSAKATIGSGTVLN